MFAAFGLLLACTPENNNGGGGQNNSEELTTTSEALEVTDFSALLTGYANLPFELGEAEVGIMYDKLQSFAGVKKVAATGLDGQNKFKVTVTDLEPSTTYYYKSYVQNGKAVKYGAVRSFMTKESTMPVGAVDLGIVMTRADGTFYKLYWATSNLSVNGLCANPEDYGDYYAWGETELKSEYSWVNYKFRTSGDKDSNVKISKYNTSSSYGPQDNKTVLEPEDDVAHVKLGSKWRMPTDEEWTALRTNCNWIQTTQNGVKGRLITSKTNKNSIFLPAAGLRYDTVLGGAGSNGYYWSSSLSTRDPGGAWSVRYFPYEVYRDDYDRRCYGLSIRPVSE